MGIVDIKRITVYDTEKDKDGDQCGFAQFIPLPDWEVCSVEIKELDQNP